MPYNLIKLGDRALLLFDISKPDGENIEKELSQQMREKARQLEQRLNAWGAELQPPSLAAKKLIAFF